MTNRNTIALGALTLLASLAWTSGAFAQSGDMVWDGTKWTKPASAEPGTPGGDLLAMRSLLEQGKYGDVVDAAETFLATHSETTGREEAMNLAGQAQFDDGNYWKAYSWYQRQTATFPKGAFYDRAMDREYRIADAFLLGRKRKAWGGMFRLPAYEDGTDILLQIAQTAPGTSIAENSLLRVGDYYFEEERYPEATATYDEFVRDLPLSGRRPYAMFQAAKSCLLDYRGAPFDDTPLLDAQARFRALLQAFPPQAKTENVASILEEVRLALAHKVYYTAEFYQRIHKPNAAAFYYKRVLRDYSDTHWAETATDRLIQLGRIQPADIQDNDDLDAMDPTRDKTKNADAKGAKKTADPDAAKGDPTPKPVHAPADDDASKKADAPEKKEDARTKPVPLESLKAPAPPKETP
jgi:outer membrane assembly lipoprotein YfiO